jgi:hypothetical protein
MRFLHIDPAAHRITPVEASDPHQAVPKLSALNVDHGVVAPGIGIIVFEYGLLEGDGPYFVLGGQLYSGDAILYGFDKAGETVDIPKRLSLPLPIWLDTKADVELAIASGVVRRPQASINGVLTWQWS